MKKNIKILIIITITLAVSTTVILFIMNINKSQKEMQTNKELIKSNYQELTTQINTYNEIRNNYITLSKDFYYETYESKHEDYTNLLTKYNEVIKNIDKSISNIDKRCNVIYDDLEINNICSSYQVLYEKIINLYITDLSSYNDKIDGYNQYKETNINKFSMIHNNYIDYNKDNIYEGKEQINNISNNIDNNNDIENEGE